MSRYVLKAVDAFFSGRAKPHGGMQNVKFDTNQKQANFVKGTGVVFTDIMLTSHGFSIDTEVNVLQFCSKLEQAEGEGNTLTKTSGVAGNHHILLHPTVSGGTSSDVAFSWAQARLNDCHSSHQQPNCAFQKVRLPTRLLNLTTFDQRSPDSSRILIWEPKPEYLGHYICLSYSWGGDQPLKLRSSNLADFMTEGIRWIELPKAIREAVEFVRRLGCAFLLIDALCIIQDSLADKDLEIAKMGSIYRNSHLVLCITKSKSVQDTCYGRVENEFLGIEIENTESTHNPTPISIRHALRHFDHATGYSLGSNSRDFHLLSRAWTLQEIILAPRVLHFGPQELLWECQGCQTCQCGNTFFRTSKGRNLISTLPPEPTPSQQESHIESWELLLANYASRNLTFGGDRCNAILGVVDYMKSVGNEFSAGLWTSFLRPLLLWSVSEKPRPRPRTEWPSWSWLSVCFKQGVHLQHWTPRRGGRAEGRYLFDAPLSLHAEGQAKSTGFDLEIVGQLVRFPGKRFEIDAPRFQSHDDDDTSWPWFLQEKFGYFMVDLDCLEVHEDPKFITGGLFFLPVLLDEKNIYFLLLRGAQNKSGCYERLGIGILFSRPSKSSEARTLESRFWDEHGQDIIEKETIVIV